MPSKSLLVLFISALWLAGCSGGNSAALEEAVEKNYDFPLNGTLSVRNEDGSIHIYASDQPGLRLQATKRAYSAARLNQIKVLVSSHNDSLAIATHFPPKKKWAWGDRSGTVDYTLVVPEEAKIASLDLVNGEISIEGMGGGTVNANLINGRIGARNCFGDMDFRVANGNIDFFYNWWEKESYVAHAAIVNGGVGFFAPMDASFRIQASTASGRIMGNFAREKEGTEGPVRKLETIVGKDPGPTFHLEARTGHINLEGF